MSHLRSMPFAAVLAVAALGFSGHLVPASAEQASPQTMKLAQQTSPSGASSFMTESTGMGLQKQNVWQSVQTPSLAGVCEVRCRSSFTGYH
jgi:hypothetical protein